MQDSQALPQQVEVWSGVGAEGSQSFRFVILPLYLSDDPSRVLKPFLFYIKGGPVDCALLALPTGSGQCSKSWGDFFEESVELFSGALMPWWPADSSPRIVTLGRWWSSILKMYPSQCSCILRSIVT